MSASNPRMHLSHTCLRLCALGLVPPFDSAKICGAGCGARRKGYQTWSTSVSVGDGLCKLLAMVELMPDHPLMQVSTTKASKKKHGQLSARC